MPKTSKQPAVKAAAKKESAGNNNNSMLEDFFYEELKDIYWAEKHLTKVLPKMAKAATAEELRDAFAHHLTVTQTQVDRLEQVFEMLNKKAQSKKCDAMEGLTKEAESIMEDTEEGTATRDVGLILAAQKVEHYEIATYGGLTQLARTLQLEDVAALLERTLREEKDADTSLTDIAENSINYEAAEEDAE